MIEALTDEQLAAVTAPLTPSLLIVAGAGTGKTTVMIERIVHIVETAAARADEILALTFTNKAAAELKSRVRDRLPDVDVTVGTYHGFAGRLIDEHKVELDLHPAVEVLNRAQAWQLLFTVFDEFRFERRATFRPDLIVNEALQLASRCADHLVALDDLDADCDDLIARAPSKGVRSAALGRRELSQVVRAYQRRKTERRLIDFDDQIRLAVALLREHPDVAARVRAQHPVVLLDEYQDTNYAQRVLLEQLYPAGSSVTAVGDDMQSIYGFRGAYLGNILRFEQHFPPAIALPLTENRRSGAAIVALANRIHAQVVEAREKVLHPLPGAPPALVECFLAADDVEEASTIAAEVAALGAPYAERAVLCRKRRLIPTIVEALEARAIPVDVVGGGGLLARPEVVDLVAWLELLSGADASVALVRILQGPRYRIGWRDLAAVARAARRDGATLVAAALAPPADVSPAAAERLHRFAQELREFSNAGARLPVAELIEAIATGTGLWGAAGARGQENLLRLLDVADRFAPVEGDRTIAAFVEYLRLLEDAEEELAEAHLSDSDAVRVMTIHQAKGLEFDHVWVPGLAGGKRSKIFPDSRATGNPLTQTSALPWWLGANEENLPSWTQMATDSVAADLVRRRQLDEERRLLYVACTRARHHLVVSAAQWYPGPSEPQGPSEFYELVRSQGDLVTERFSHEPTTTNPALAAMVRRRAAAESPPAAVPAQLSLGLDTDDGAATPARAARRSAVALGVTSIVTYGQCPRRFYVSVVRPLPRVSSLAQRIGTDVHRWIEKRSIPALELDIPEPAGGRPSPVVAGFRSSFLASPYAALQPEFTEAGFALAVDGHIVRGVSDAAYRRDGRFDVVDYKTGRQPHDGDGGAAVQLALYGIAAVDAWRVDPDELSTTYCYLRVDEPAILVTTHWSAALVERARGDLRALLGAIDSSHYDPTAGPWCGSCDFLSACRAGQEMVELKPPEPDAP